MLRVRITDFKKKQWVEQGFQAFTAGIKRDNWPRSQAFNSAAYWAEKVNWQFGWDESRKIAQHNPIPFVPPKKFTLREERAMIREVNHYWQARGFAAAINEKSIDSWESRAEEFLTAMGKPITGAWRIRLMEEFHKGWKKGEKYYVEVFGRPLVIPKQSDSQTPEPETEAF